MEIKDFKTKKNLKKYVNENGRFLQMSLNVITNETTKIPKAHKESIPVWASYFKWIASNGDLNRNGYIIRPNAWKKSLANFVDNWVVLYQHDPEKPIGKPLSAKVVKDELIVEGFVYDDTYSEGNIGRGLVTGISTGHISEAVEFQHKDTGDVISEEEFDELLGNAETFAEWLDILYSYILVVTQADLVEFSFVTLPSNKGAKITQKNAVLARLWVDSEESLQSKFNEMKNVIKKVKVNETEEKIETKEEEKIETKEEEKEEVEEKVEENRNWDGKWPAGRWPKTWGGRWTCGNDVKEEVKEEVKEQETPENGGETPSTEEEASENDEETPEEDLSKDKNVVKANSMEAEFKELKINFASTDSRIGVLENSLKNKDSQIEELTNALKEVINVVALNKSNLGSLIVNWVSSYVEKNKEDVRPRSTLTNALEKFKT